MIAAIISCYDSVSAKMQHNQLHGKTFVQNIMVSYKKVLLATGSQPNIAFKNIYF